MKTFIRTIKWAWKAWPLWLLIGVAILHYLAHSFFPQSTTSINKSVALACQLVGGALVLLSIDSNLGILRKENLFGAFIAYLKRFPPINLPQQISLSSQLNIKTSVLGELTIGKNPETIEGKLEYLQEQIDELKEKYTKSLIELKTENQKNIQRLQEQINNAQSSVALLENNLDKVSAGGVPVQIFGVLLVVYGSITGHTV